MNTQFCKIKKTTPKIGDLLGLNDLEKKYKAFIEEAYNVMQTDSGLSDILYHEASKLKKTIFNLKSSGSIDAAF